jgi:hypothetical protein
MILVLILGCTFFCIGIFPENAFLGLFSVHAQVSGGTDVNVSRKPGSDSECAIAKNPVNKVDLFIVCMTSSAGFFAASSQDGGESWNPVDPTDSTIADGNPTDVPLAYADPSVAWDSFGNLFLAYVALHPEGGRAIATVVSTDGGLTFTTAMYQPGSVDHPTVVAANTSKGPAPVAAWVVWEQSGQMRAQGAEVKGLGDVTFKSVQVIPGTTDCSFGDVAISPEGVVVQVCQTPMGGEGPGTLKVNIDADGLDPQNFSAASIAATTNVGGLDFIAAQNNRGISADAGLAYDSSTSVHGGRLYLVYSDDAFSENSNPSDTDAEDVNIMLRFSDDNGQNWSAAIKVNDDTSGRSQFLPRISVNPTSGNIAVCWLDARNSSDNKSVQMYCSIATPTNNEPAFLASAPVSDGVSTSPGASSALEFGDYSGLVYLDGVHPVWADKSGSGGLNPDDPIGLPPPTKFDAYTDRVTGGAAASEGEPHIKTVDGVHYDFQSAGEFTVLRGDGLEIQTRQTPVTTATIPKPNPHLGVPTCVSLNTAIAALVGTHKISYQPNIRGQPESNGLDLFVDGEVKTLDDDGLDLSPGGRIIKSAVGNGIEVDFPNGTRLIVTQGWWAAQGKRGNGIST